MVEKDIQKLVEANVQDIQEARKPDGGVAENMKAIRLQRMRDTGVKQIVTELTTQYPSLAAAQVHIDFLQATAPGSVELKLAKEHRLGLLLSIDPPELAAHFEKYRNEKK